MDEVLLQDYELSVWETYVPEDSATGNFEERKVAVIGSSAIHSNTSAYNVAIKENINGEKTLTFSLARKYRNDEGELVDNPFLSLLSAERIVKLRDGEAYEMTGNTPEEEVNSLLGEDEEERWKDFVIKTIDEDSTTYVNNYSCKEVFVNELGKNGWSTVLDTELENNYGTVIELAETILQGSGWKVSEDSYNPTARVDEQLFVVPYKESWGEYIEAKNVLNTAQVSYISSGYLYFFYSDVEVDGDVWKVTDKNAVDGQLQFMYPGISVPYFTPDMADDNNVIIDENDVYNLEYSASLFNGIEVYPVGSISDPTACTRPLLGGRIVKSVNSHFEPVADKYVEDWEVNETKEKVYHYQETEYATSDIVQNYLANSTNFVSQIGWANRSANAGSITDGFQFHTMPIPEDLPSDVTTAEDWLPTNYMVLPKGSNTYKYHNSGLSDQHIRLVEDKIYVFRWHARVIDETADSYTTTSLPTSSTYGNDVTVKLVYQDSTSGTLQYTEASNEVTVSNFIRNNTAPTDNDNSRGYPVPVDAQTYRTAYSESALGKLYIDEQGYAYCFLKANYSTKAFGEDAFLELKMSNSSSYPNYKWHVQDIQFFEYKEQTVDSKTIPIFPGDIPTASVITNDVFYRVVNGSAGKEVEFLSSNKDLYTPIRKEGYTAVRHLEVKESNYFNNISSLAELFEVWVKFKVRHKKNGALLLDDTGMPIKEVVFSRFAPGSKENYAGFRYGVNLKNIKRNITSQNIATKLIVKDNNNEFATDGMCSIRRAKDNPTGENIIFNFDYFVNQGLVDYTQLLRDQYGLLDTDLGYNWRMKQLNDEMLPLSELLVECQGQIQSAEEMIEYAETSIESTQSELLWQQQIYSSYAEAGIGDGTQEIKKSTIAQLQAQLIAFEKSLATYQEQMDYYNGLIYGQSVDGSTLEYKGLWKKSENYEKNAVVSIQNDYALRAFRSTQDANKDEPGVSSKWIEITNNVAQMGLADRVTYYGDRKQQLNLAFFRKYHRYIQEGTWTDEQYIDDNLYYFDAQKVSSQSAYPKTTYTIGVIDIQGNLSYAPYHFDIGDRTYVEDTEFFGYTLVDVSGELVKTPFKKQVIVSERTRNLDDPSKSTITIQTYKNQFEELFSKITATTQSLQYASGGYDRAANAIKPTGEIEISTLENAFANNAWILANSKNQSVTWDSGLGITVTDVTNSSVALRITSNGIMMTTDGGQTWINGITGQGINTRYLLAGQIDASKINIIGDSGYAFKWDQNGLSAFDKMDTETSQTRYVRFNRYGLFGTTSGADLQIALDNLGESATIEDYLNAIQKHSNFALTWEGLSLRAQDGSVSLTPDGGLEVFGPSWYFPKETVGEVSNVVAYPYIYDPDGVAYTSSDLIPLVSLGQLRYEQNGEAYYGLQLRNKQGYITLRTNNDGDLWLSNSLSIGDTAPYSTEILTTSQVYVARDDEDNTIQLELPTGQLMLTKPISCIDTGAEYTVQESEIEIAGQITTITISPATVFDTEDPKVKVGGDYYNFQYSENKSQYRFLGINGATDAFFRTYKETSETGEVFWSSEDNPVILFAGHTVRNSAPFRVYANGEIVASDAEISGIINALGGNFSGQISVGGSSGINGSLAAPYAFWAGMTDNEPVFYVTPEGYMEAQSVKIYGDSSFEGTIVAHNGSFSGIIEARQGRINQLFINDTSSYIGTGTGIGDELPQDISLLQAITPEEQGEYYYYPIPQEYQEAWENVTSAQFAYEETSITISCNGTHFFVEKSIIEAAGFAGEVPEGTVITAIAASDYTPTQNGDLFFNINNAAFGVNKLGHYFGTLAALVPNDNWMNFVGTMLNGEEPPAISGAVGSETSILADTFVDTFGIAPEVGMIVVVERSGDTPRSLRKITSINDSGNIEYETIAVQDDQLTTTLPDLTNRWSRYNILFGDEVYSGYILNIFSPEVLLDEDGQPIIELPQSHRVFGIRSNGSVEISGTLTTQGDLLFGGRLVSTSRNLVIDGLNGSIYSNAGWWLDENGDAQFNNVSVRGKIESVVFSYNKKSAIGGTMVITPTLYIEEPVECVDGIATISLGTSSTAIWEKINQVDINIPPVGRGEAKVLVGVEITVSQGSIQFNTTETVIPAGTQIISTSTNVNSIELTAENENGSTIIMRGNDTNNSLSMLGYINYQELDNQSLEYFPELQTTATYGLFANNAYITGQIALPNAGITNGDIPIADVWNGRPTEMNHDSDEGKRIRFWAGRPDNNISGTKNDISQANFIVTEDGTLYAQDGIFNGRVNAQNSDFSGFVRATGIILGEQPGGTNYSHFYFQWEEDVWGEDIVPSISKYIMDVNRYGLNIWQGGINVFSDYYSLDSQRNGNFYGWEAPADAEDGYWPESNAPWPIFTTLDQTTNEANFIPRVSMTNLQVWKAENNTTSQVFGASFSGEKIDFQKITDQLNPESNYRQVADKLIESSPYLSIGTHNDEIGIAGSYLSIHDSSGNQAISFEPKPESEENEVGNNSTIQIFGNTKFSTVMQIEQVADGLIFTYIGE